METILILFQYSQDVYDDLWPQSAFHEVVTDWGLAPLNRPDQWLDGSGELIAEFSYRKVIDLRVIINAIFKVYHVASKT